MSLPFPKKWQLNRQKPAGTLGNKFVSRQEGTFKR